MKLNNGLDLFCKKLTESYAPGTRDCSNALLDLVDDGVCSARKILGDLVFWLPEEEICRFMEDHDLTPDMGEELDDVYECMFTEEVMTNKHVPLSQIAGTAAQIISSNWDRYETVQSKQDVIDLTHELLDNSPRIKDSQALQRWYEILNNKKDLAAALIYLGDLVLAGDNLKVIK